MTRRPFEHDIKGSRRPTEDSDLVFHVVEFNSEYPTDAACLEELCRRSDTGGWYKCRHCGACLSNKQYGDRVSQCQNCHRSTWHTAGTFFEGIRVARAWLAAIWLMEHGVALTSSKFAQLFGIAQSTAFNILHKLRTVIRKYMEHNPPTASSASFSIVFRRRSSATPANTHPRAEQAEIEKTSLNCSALSDKQIATNAATSFAADIGAKYFGRLGAQHNHAPTMEDGETNGEGKEETAATGDSQIETVGLPGREQEIYDLLSEQKLSVDTLCELTGLQAAELSVSLFILELAKLIRREPGDCYTRCKLEPDQELGILPAAENESKNKIGITIAAAIGFILDRCHGISRKYLQNYLAAYWCYNDRTTWCPGSLLQLCRLSPAIKHNEILDYVSPLMVRLMSETESQS